MHRRSHDRMGRIGLGRLRSRRWLASLGALVFAACSAPEAHDPRPLVFVSVPPQRFVVERLAGEALRVEVMIPPGASPTQYEPTLAQLEALQGAALYWKIGHPAFPFERAWLERLLADVPELVVADASEGIPLHRGDPHYWLAPRWMGVMADNAAAALSRAAPEHAAAIEARRTAFQTELAALDAELRATLEAGRSGGAPPAKPAFMVFHPAWGYFADAYGLEQLAIEQDHKEPSGHALAERIARAKAEGIRVIFVQPQFDPSAAESVAREVGARVAPLDPLAADWDANLRRTAQALAESFAR